MFMQAPGPAPVWDGTFEAINENIRCTQSRFSALGQDDCLILNVYTPLSKHPSNYLPVMVFIHGGGFYEGSSNKVVYGPIYLVDKGVILVTVNYRLNVNGFLSLGIKEAPGNAGMKDQVAALRWVQANIRAFGGDPDNVTIFGESAGGASVSYHILSSMSKGLFHKAILQSGSSLASWAFQHDPLDAALIRAKALGFTGPPEPSDLYRFYISKTSPEYHRAEPPRKEEDFAITQKVVFVPCEEKIFDGVEPFLTESPFTILSEGRYNKVPLIIGANSDEGILFAAIESYAGLSKVSFEESLPRNLIFPSVDERKRIAGELRQMYMGDDKIIENLAKVSKFIGEAFFNFNAAEETSLIVKTNDKPVYHYSFAYSGWKNIVKLMTTGDLRKLKGASHADELCYLFSQIPSMFEDRMIFMMTTMWTNFAKYGNPTPAVTDLPIKWPAVTAEDQRSLIIDQSPSIEPIWEDRLLFWKETYAKYRRI